MEAIQNISLTSLLDMLISLAAEVSATDLLRQEQPGGSGHSSFPENYVRDRVVRMTE
jgi:hypothetical protein